MIKFSRRRKTQPTPPVCKGVPPAGTDTIPPPGLYAQASVTYQGATSGAPITATAAITLTMSGAYPHYAGKTIDPAGTLLLLTGTITSDPPHTSLTLIGQSANGDFFSALGSSDAIAYNPWLTSELIALVPANFPAAAAVTLLQ